MVEFGPFTLDVKELGNANVLFGNPCRSVIACAALHKVAAIVSVRVVVFKDLLVHHRGNQATLCVRAIRQDAVWVKVHGKRVVNRVDVDFLVERIFTHITGVDAPVAPTHANGVVKRCVIGCVGVAVDFNVSGHALNHLGNLVVGKVVDGVNFNPWALLALLVCDLPNVRINFVDGQARTGFNVAAVLNLDRPLVASGKLNIVQRLRTVGAVSVID